MTNKESRCQSCKLSCKLSGSKTIPTFGKIEKYASKGCPYKRELSEASNALEFLRPISLEILNRIREIVLVPQIALVQQQVAESMNKLYSTYEIIAKQIQPFQAVWESITQIQFAVISANYYRNYFAEISRMFEHVTALSVAMQQAVKIYETLPQIATEIRLFNKEIRQMICPGIQKLSEDVYESGLKEEKIEETDKLIKELVDSARVLKIFDNFCEQLSEGLDNFHARKFHASFNTLLDIVEGVIRKIYVGAGLGGSGETLVPMVEKLVREKHLLPETGYLIKSLERNLADHGRLCGDYRDFPESFSRLVVLSLVKIARDYKYKRTHKQKA